MADQASLTRLCTDVAAIQAAVEHFARRQSDDACEEYAQVTACLDKAHDWLRVRRERALKAAQTAPVASEASLLRTAGLEDDGGSHDPGFDRKPAPDDTSATSYISRLD